MLNLNLPSPVTYAHLYYIERETKKKIERILGKYWNRSVRFKVSTKVHMYLLSCQLTNVR